MYRRKVVAGTDFKVMDLNGDLTVDSRDRDVWVHDLATTYFGDANLDGEFNSGDMVDVFTVGQYEDAIQCLRHNPGAP